MVWHGIALIFRSNGINNNNPSLNIYPTFSLPIFPSSLHIIHPYTYNPTTTKNKQNETHNPPNPIRHRRGNPYETPFQFNNPNLVQQHPPRLQHDPTPELYLQWNFLKCALHSYRRSLCLAHSFRAGRCIRWGVLCWGGDEELLSRGFAQGGLSEG